MTDKEMVGAAVLKAIEAVNERLPEDERVTPGRDTEILGPSRSVDSLGLVELIIEIEATVRDELGVTLNLANESELLSRSQGTIGTVIDYIEGMLQKLES